MSKLKNINICFVGRIGTGKSTIINSILKQDFINYKVKNSTMIPTIFINWNWHLSNIIPNNFTNSHISNTILQTNKYIETQVEKKNKFNLSNFGNQLIFDIGKCESSKIKPKIQIKIYDIPGLNDSRTNKEYYNYLEKNFNLFDIVVFVSDINSYPNAFIDDLHILHWITENIRTQATNGKIIKFIGIVNKVDWLQFDNHSNTYSIVCENHHKIFNQINSSIAHVFCGKNLSPHLIGIFPMSGIDAHLYQMVNIFGSNYNLNAQQIQRIGINKFAHMFRFKTIEEQKEIIRTVIDDKSFICDMIKLSGFEQIEKILRNLKKN